MTRGLVVVPTVPTVLAALLAAVLTTLGTTVLATPSAAASLGPDVVDGVDYSPTAGIRAALADPGAATRGTDRDCRPSPRHPRPVVLLHGTGMTGPGTWTTLAPALAAEGFCVVAPTYGAFPVAPAIGGLRPLVGDAGDEVAALIDDVLARTGADQVDLVGHSLGGPVAAYVAKVLRPGRVGTVVFAASYWMRPGTTTVSNVPALRPLEESGRLRDVIAMGPVYSGADLVRPSVLVDEVWAGGTPYAPGTRYRTIASEHDEVFPPHIAVAGVPGGDDVVVQDGCPGNRTGHLTAPSDPRVVDLVIEGLDPSGGREIHCAAGR